MCATDCMAAHRSLADEERAMCFWEHIMLYVDHVGGNVQRLCSGRIPLVNFPDPQWCPFSHIVFEGLPVQVYYQEYDAALFPWPHGFLEKDSMK